MGMKTKRETTRRIVTVLPKTAATPDDLRQAEKLLGKGGVANVNALLVENGRVIGGRR